MINSRDNIGHRERKPGVVINEDFEFDRVDTLESAVFQALGAVSVCWENMNGTGIFDSDRALAIGKALIAKIRELREEENDE